MRVVHVPCYAKEKLTPFNHAHILVLRLYGKIGVLTTAQYANQLSQVVEYLNHYQIPAVEGGVILGCNQNSAEKIEHQVDAYLYIGTGRFHPLGVAFKTRKKVLLLNPTAKTLEELSEDEKSLWETQRRLRLQKAAAAQTFGIAVSTRDGQFSLENALELKKKLEAKGKKAFIFAGDSFNPDSTLGTEVDAWINTACPRITNDHFEKAVLNPEEIDEIMG
ncbi:2-(3-amino-3-carboxypropyl)histidine synthase [uncultured archaeon]|nr:2-(3-amino-3-carboxypropyl)histidine synthase [uncultured archaeon]